MYRVNRVSTSTTSAGVRVHDQLAQALNDMEQDGYEVRWPPVEFAGAHGMTEALLVVGWKEGRDA